MKSGQFKQKTLAEIKAKTALKKKNGTKLPKAKKNSAKVAKQAKSSYMTVIPPWFKSIPLGSHGNNPTQKRYWKLISDLCRQRDFNQFKGKCVSCPKKLKHWNEGDAAHFRRYSTCNSYMKFNPINIALSCKNCNRNDDGVVGHSFGEELKRRYGANHLKLIEKENTKHHGQKLEDHVLIQMAEKLLDDNPWFLLP